MKCQGWNLRIYLPSHVLGGLDASEQGPDDPNVEGHGNDNRQGEIDYSLVPYKGGILFCETREFTMNKL